MTTISIDKLRTDVEGRVIGPDDPDYDESRAVFYGGIDKRPEVIVRVANDADVSTVIALARETGLELAVRSGGHSVPGHSVSEGGIVLDLADLRAIDVDAGDRTAWVETGLTAVEVANAAAAHGLAIGFGDTGSVGIGGITLGGGVGYLARKFGLTIDDLLAADVVTADGEIHRVDAETEPDLFWSIRGGGGNFGVATRFRFRLHELAGVVGGMLFLPATTDTISGFIEAAEDAPEELSTIANVMPAPPMPFLPEEHHGKPVIFGLMCYAGDEAGGERALAPFRRLATPIGDLVKPIPYPEIYPPEEEEYHPIATGHTMYLDTAGRTEAGTILEHLATSIAMMGVAQLRVLGGAVARVPAEATAFAHRTNRIMVNVAAVYEKSEERTTHEPWVRRLAAALHQGDDAAYVNFLGDEGPDRIRAAYPGGTWDRLR
ncbi:MAG TPA: FAD-binding oxidoreductase, partial [Actinomycetota bacterium]|nr:FAD-binding oxidoreductase [Actinomycetota bacterium]